MGGKLGEVDVRLANLEARQEVLGRITPFLETMPHYEHFPDFLLETLRPQIARITDERLPQINIMGEFERLDGELHTRFDSLAGQLQDEASYARDLEGQLEEVRAGLTLKSQELNEVKKLLAQKAAGSDLRRVEDELERALKTFELYVKKDTFEASESATKQELHAKAEKRQVFELKDALDAFQKKMQQALHPLASKEHVSDKTAWLREKLEKDMTAFAMTTTLEKLRFSHDHVQDRVGELERRVKENKQKGEELEGVKATKEEVKRLWERLLDYSTLKQLAELENKVFPEIADFRVKIAQFDRENETAKGIIRGFDSVLLEKASKFSVEELHRKLEEYLLHTDFQKNNEQIARSFVGQTQAHEALQGDLKTLEEGIGRQIFEAVRRATLKLTKQSVGGGEGGGVASEELRVVMQSKADRSELERVGQTKANKVDVEANMKAVDILHRHTSHLSTLVMEVVKGGHAGGRRLGAEPREPEGLPPAPGPQRAPVDQPLQPALREHLRARPARGAPRLRAARLQHARRGRPARAEGPPLRQHPEGLAAAPRGLHAPAPEQAAAPQRVQLPRGPGRGLPPRQPQGQQVSLARQLLGRPALGHPPLLEQVRARGRGLFRQAEAAGALPAHRPLPPSPLDF